MPVMMHDGGRYSPPPPPPPPPPPTPANLQAADPRTANASIAQMTPPQQARLTGDVAAMPVAERTALLNDLATKLESEQLVALEPVFGQGAVREAVETRSSATVREAYTQQAPSTPATPAASASEQVAHAQADYEDHVASHGLPAQALMTELMVEHQAEPAYLAEMVRLAHADGTLEMALNPMQGGLYERDGEAYSWTDDGGVGGDARRSAFETAITAALDRGTLTPTDIRALGANSSGWQDVASRVGVAQVGTTEATAATSTELSELNEAQAEAQDDALRLDEKLGGLLAQAGPMTPEQQAAFVEAYRNDPENKPTYDKAIEANAGLAEYMGANRDAVLDAAVRDPEVAQQVNDAIEAMATHGHGVEALELLAEIQRVPDSALGDAFAGFTGLSDDVLTDAASSAMSELLARNDGSVTQAQAQFTTLMGAFGQGAPAWGGYKEVTDGLALLDAFANGDYRAVDMYARQYDNSKPLFRAFAAGGVVLGSVSAVNNATNEEYALAIGGLAQSGENGARLVSGAMTSLADSGRLAQYAGTFADAGGFAARLAPGLGLIASSASLVNSIDEASDGNAGYAIAAAGDVLGVLGGAFELFPLTAPAGFIVSGIGAVVSGLGSFVGELINGNERREDIERYLTEAGVDPDIVGEMASRGSDLFDMAETLDMDAGEVQALLASHPEVAMSAGHLGIFGDTADALGLTGSEVVSFAGRLAQDDPNFAWTLFNAGSSAGSLYGDQRAAFLRDQVEINFAQAAAYAESASPELFGEAAEQRERASSDFQLAGSSMSWELGVGNLLTGNDHPAYRAEIIGTLHEEGRLEMWAQHIGGYGGDWAEAGRAALDNAVEAGVISRSDADAAEAYLG